MSQKSRTDEGAETHNSPDYSDVRIPSKPPSEYSYVERRGELLDQIMSLGHPSMIHQGEMADRYDVSQSQISRDIKRLGQFMEDSLGDRRELTTEAVFRRCITGLLEEEEWRAAAQTVSDWDEWLTERHELEELRERIARLESGRGGGL